MAKPKEPVFSQLVCSSPAVRTALTPHAPARAWWKLILALHGKPQNPTLTSGARIECIARGFKFYAWLYRLLSVIFMVLSPIFMALDVAENHSSSLYWAGGSLLAGIYLWGISGLGYAGARTYRFDQEKGRTSLLAFMVMVVAFLSMFVAVVSVVANGSAWVAPLPNLLGAGLLFVFGIGSYFIEIIYLATDHRG